jgi:hypothetical protein
MSYFKFFESRYYKFGDEITLQPFQNLSLYADVVDQIKDDIAFYNKREIQEYQRPDQLSFELYDTPNYHWTFYLMNDNIKQNGWPLSNREINLKALKDYPDKVLTVREDISTIFSVGQTIRGQRSGTTAVIKHRDLDLGKITIHKLSGSFRAGETIFSTNIDGEEESIIFRSITDEHLSPHHYIDATGAWVDINPFQERGANEIPVTNLDYLLEQNEALKSIRVIKPSLIEDVILATKEAVRA